MTALDTSIDATELFSREAFRSVSSTYDGAQLADPHALYAELRRSTPVMDGDILARFGVPSQADYGNCGRQVFTVFRHADVMAILRDDAGWTSDLLMDGLGTFLGDMLLSARDGADHRSLKALLQPCFAPPVLRQWNENLIVPLVQQTYGQAMRPHGRAELVAEFALPFPIRAIYAMMGFPDDAAALDRFAERALLILAGPQVDPVKAQESRLRAFQASQELFDELVVLIADRRSAGTGRGGNDMIAHLIRAQSAGESLTDAQIANIIRMILPAAAETTTRTIANLVTMLFEHPDVMERLRADRTLLPRAITESMRLDPVAAFLARRATRDMVVQGVTIPRDAAVSLVIASANRDEAVFEDPDLFNIDRPSRPTMGFGFGVHMCIGMPIARLEIEAAMNMLLDLPGLRPDPAHPAPVIRGMQFRGPAELRVVWDRVAA